MKNKTKRIISLIVVIIMIVSTIILSTISVFASESSPSRRILAIGESLSDEQKQLIYEYLSINDTSNIDIITITNSDEHYYLDNILDKNKIGSKTYSCCYIEPTNNGGVHVKTVNLSYVTSDMIQNAMITSGIENANVICLSPFEVSGTGALAGIFKAYGDSLDNEKVEVAYEELLETLSLSNYIGNDDATQLMEYFKKSIISGEIKATDIDSILDDIDNYITEHDLVLTEERKLKIAKILFKIAGYDYDTETIRNSYNDFTNTISSGIEKTQKTISFIDEATRFFKNLWSKITGNYNEIYDTDEFINTISIFGETKDSIISNNINVTSTDNIELLTQEIEEKEERKIWSLLADIINKSYDNTEKNLQSAINTESSEKIKLTFEIGDNQEDIDIEEDNKSVLDYIQYHEE